MMIVLIWENEREHRPYTDVPRLRKLRSSTDSSEASAMNFVCQAVGPRSVGYGRAFFVADAKWQALLRCERYSGICIISYCVPTSRDRGLRR